MNTQKPSNVTHCRDANLSVKHNPIILPLVPCLSRGTPSPSHNTSTDPVSFLGGGVPQWLVPGQDRGTGYPKMGVPSTRDGVLPGQVRMGRVGGTLGHDGVPLPWPGIGYPRTRSGQGIPHDGVTPRPGMGYPPDRTADGVLDMPGSVWLLRSRRRTF